MNAFRGRLLSGALVAVGILVGMVVTIAAIRPQADPPPDTCRETATVLYGHVGGMFDQITQEALIRGGFTGHFEIQSDGEVFPRVWYDFVTACVPPPPLETGTS